MAGPQLSAEPARPAKAAPAPAKPKPRRRAKRAGPVSAAQAQASINAYYGFAPSSDVDRINAEVAAEYFADDVKRRVSEMATAFATNDPAQHAYGAGLIGSIADEKLLAIQEQWHKTQKTDLYPYLFGRASVNPTAGLAHALVLLRQGFARNPPLQRAFFAVYANPAQISAYVAQVRDHFVPLTYRDKEDGVTKTVANSSDKLGLGALRDQPKAVLDLIKAEFKALYHQDLLAWMVAQVPRTEASVRAMAILKTGDDRGNHVDLAATIIPPDHGNKDIPLIHLRGNSASRQRLENAFNATFKGIGPGRGESTPDTLRGYLDLKLGHAESAVDRLSREVYSYHEALIRLHHEPTDAERLYLTVSRWWDTRNDSAIGLLQDFARRGVGRQQLEADWARFVSGGLEGTLKTPFTTRGLREHLIQVYAATPTRTREYLLALYDGLDGETAEAAGPELALENSDQRAEQAEERQLRSAFAMLDSRIADDKGILDALERIAATLRARMARLQRRRAATAVNWKLKLEQRTQWLAKDDAAIAQAEQESRQIRVALTEQIDNRFDAVRSPLRKFAYRDDRDIRISEEKKGLAALVLGDDYTPADSVYSAIVNRENGAAAQVEKIWASGGVEALLTAAARPGQDVRGIERREPYEVAGLAEKMLDRVNGSRIVAMTRRDLADPQRGVERILVELNQGNADTNLGPIADLFASLERNPDLKKSVLAAFAEFAIRTGHLAATDQTSPADYFLDEMSRRFEGRADNWLRLKSFVAPPQTAVERAEFARERRSVRSRALLSGMTTTVADVVDAEGGEYLGEAAARTQDRLEFFANASDAQLAPHLEAAGVSTRKELSEQELATFEARQANRAQLEQTCAELIAGMVETLTEAGLSVLTGGAGLPAVIGAMVASVVSMVASEALLGPNYQLLTWENAGKIFLDGVSTSLFEFNTRDLIVDGLPLKFLGKHETVRQTIQNVTNGLVEGAVTGVAELAFTGVSQLKWPNSDELARQVDLVLGRLAAKAISTQGTVKYHPGQYRPYVPFVDRLKTNILFKLSLKLTEGGAKELINIALSTSRDQMLADQLLRFLWKEARGVVSTTTKGIASAVGGAATDAHERQRITAARAANPVAFAIVVRDALLSRYAKSQQLQAEHELLKGGNRLSPEEFMLYRMRHGATPLPPPSGVMETMAERKARERPEPNEILISKIHDDIYSRLDTVRSFKALPVKRGVPGLGKPVTLVGDIAEQALDEEAARARGHDQAAAEPQPAPARAAAPLRAQPGEAPEGERRQRPAYAAARYFATAPGTQRSLFAVPHGFASQREFLAKVQELTDPMLPKTAVRQGLRDHHIDVAMLNAISATLAAEVLARPGDSVPRWQLQVVQLAMLDMTR